MRRLAILLALLQIAVASAAAAQSQSLAAVARREEQRRRTIKKPAPLYTNKDLKAGRESGAVAQEGETPAAAPAAEGAGAAPDLAAAPAESPEDKDEKQAAEKEQAWRARMSEARTQLERSKMFAEALQTRVNSLWADFTARDDPAQRASIEAERKKTLAELDRVKAEIEAQTKAIADIEDEARRAGVPPGWLR